MWLKRQAFGVRYFLELLDLGIFLFSNSFILDSAVVESVGCKEPIARSSKTLGRFWSGNQTRGLADRIDELFLFRIGEQSRIDILE